MKNYTDITVLVDRSGSMESIKSAMEEAYNIFLKKHQETPSSRITLIQFDGENPQQVDYVNVPITAADPLKLSPRGWTPLLDAMATAIDNTGLRLKAIDPENRPERVLFVVITDGQENASKTYHRSDVFNRVTKQQNDYNWKFTFFGANQDLFKEAQSLGISWGSTLKYTADPNWVPMAANYLAIATSAYAGGSAADVSYDSRARSSSATQADQDQDSVPRPIHDKINNRATAKGLK